MPVEVFDPVLKESVPLVLTQEQKNAILAIIDVASSDSRFAEKAYNSIIRLLENVTVEVPPPPPETPEP